MADQIIGMYAFGTSTRDISRYFEREFNTRLSAETVSAITDRVLPEIREWKTRSLDAWWGEQYPIVIRSWRENWERLTEFFQYTKEIRRMIYTTNTV